MYEIYDPPRALTPAAAIAPSDPIITASVDAKSTIELSAKPANTVLPNQPKITATSSSIDSKQALDSRPNALQPVDTKGTPPSVPKSASPSIHKTQTSIYPAISFSSLTQSTDLGGISLELEHGQVPRLSDSKSSNEVSLVSSNTATGQPTKEGLGAIIYSAFGASRSTDKPEKHDPSSTNTLTRLDPAMPTSTVVGANSMANPSSALSVGGTTISSTGPAVNSAEAAVSIGPSGIIVGDNTISVQPAATPAKVVSAAG